MKKLRIMLVYLVDTKFINSSIRTVGGGRKEEGFGKQGKRETQGAGIKRVIRKEWC